MTDSHALLIGNCKYRDPSLRELVAPEQDVLEMKRVLEHKSIGNFGSVRTLIDSRKEDAVTILEDFFVDKSINDTLLLYFSGHGYVDKHNQFFLLFTDSDTNRPRASAISSRWIADIMDVSASMRQILILDCCFSGAIFDAIQLKGDLDFTRQFKGDGKGRVILTATSSAEPAGAPNHKEEKRALLSYYTHYLVHGLDTGQADLDGDGLVSANDLHGYICNEFEKSNISQTPRIGKFLQKGDKLIIAQTHKSASNRSSPVHQGRTKSIPLVDSIVTKDVGQINPATIYEYQAQQFGIGYERLEVSCRINDDGSASIWRTVSLIATQPYAIIDTFIILSCVDDIDTVAVEREIKISDVTSGRVLISELREYSAPKAISQIRIVPPLKRGERLRYSICEFVPKGIFCVEPSEEHLRVCSDRENWFDYFDWDINIPTQTLSLRVFFPKDYVPVKEAVYINRSVASSLSPKVPSPMESQLRSPNKFRFGDSLGFEIFEVYPILGKTYGISWVPPYLDNSDVRK